jgi:hypothetical protein
MRALVCPSVAERRRVLIALLAAFALLPDLAMANDDEPFVLSFVEGDYALIGQEPDGGTVYAGTARIAKDGDQLILDRRIAGRTQRAVGRVEVPSPPGEGQVLRFRWDDGRAVIMTCLVVADLDNYARLTCLWNAASQPSHEPGLEAMFPTAVWFERPGSQN